MRFPKIALLQCSGPKKIREVVPEDAVVLVRAVEDSGACVVCYGLDLLVECCCTDEVPVYVEDVEAGGEVTFCPVHKRSVVEQCEQIFVGRDGIHIVNSL